MQLVSMYSIKIQGSIDKVIRALKSYEPGYVSCASIIINPDDIELDDNYYIGAYNGQPAALRYFDLVEPKVVINELFMLNANRFVIWVQRPPHEAKFLTILYMDDKRQSPDYAKKYYGKEEDIVFSSSYAIVIEKRIGNTSFWREYKDEILSTGLSLLSAILTWVGVKKKG